MQQHQHKQFEALHLPADPDALSLRGVLENILRFLPQDCRLTTCSLVCNSWRDAALSVTAEAGVSARGSAALLAWLKLHGENVKSLVIHGGGIVEHSSLAGMHQLTRLELDSVTAQPALLSTIGDNLQRLKHLRLKRLDWGPLISPASRNELSEAATKVWDGCSCLTYLEATECDLDDKCVTSLRGSLRQLRSLDLSRNAFMDPRSLWGLTPHLSSLKLGSNSLSFDVAGVLISSTNRIQSDELRGGDASVAPTGRAQGGIRAAFQDLNVLDINGLFLSRPEVLRGHTMLTWLDLLQVKVPDYGEVLAVLPHLQQLQYLDLRACCGLRGPAATSAALRAALLPLTQLTTLDISVTEYSLSAGTGQNAAAGDHGTQQPATGGSLFEGLCLPRLQQLYANMCCCDDKSPMWGGADMRCLVAAFPAVRELQVYGSLQLTAAGTELQPLVALAGSLTNLQLDATGQQLRDQHMQSLAELRGLSWLSVSTVGQYITDRGIAALTALTCLSFLHLDGVTSDGVSTELLPYKRNDRGPYTSEKLQLETVVKHGVVKATVAQQLVELAAKSPQMWKETQQKLADELKTAQKEARDAKKEAAAERRKVMSAQKQAQKAQKKADGAKQQAAAVEQQLATSQDEVKALQEQLAALQLQLQEAVSASH